MQYFGAVFVRLFAIFFLVSNLSALLTFAYYAATSEQAVLTISLTVVLAGLFVFGVIFFFPGLVLRGLKPIEQNVSAFQISADSLLQTGTVLIGVYFVARGVQSLFHAVTYELIAGAETLYEMLTKPAFGTGVFALAIGLVLIFGASRISAFVMRLRHL